MIKCWFKVNVYDKIRNLYLLCAFDFDFRESDVDMVGGEILSKNTGVLSPLVDVRRRCFCSVRLARKFLESVLHCVLNLPSNSADIENVMLITY